MVRIRIGLVVCLVLSVTAGAISSSADEVKGDLARGAKFYSDNCGRCHNARAPTEHRDREWSIALIHMRIVAGLPGQQARDIEAFLRASNNPPRPVTRAVPAGLSPEQLLDLYGCRGCHLIGGRGGAVGPELDTVFERRDVEWIRAQIQRPRDHNPTTLMPQFGLSDAEVDAIIEALGAR